MSKRPRTTQFSDEPAPAAVFAQNLQNVNPYTGMPFSQRYRDILAKRVTLPVYQQREDFIGMLHTNQTIVLVGETGSGKTTQARLFR